MPSRKIAKRQRKHDPRSSTSDESFREEGPTVKMATVTMSEDIRSLRLEVSSVQDSVNLAFIEIESVKEDAGKKAEMLNKRINDPEAKLLQNEIYSKRQNLLFWGIPFKDGEDVVQEAYSIDKKLSVDNARRFAFVNVYRMPRMSGNPIIVKFVSMIERDVVLRHAYRLQPRSGVGVSKEVPVVECATYLGFKRHRSLGWDSQILHMAKKGSTRLHFLRMLKKGGMPPEDLETVYTTLIRPVLEYANVVYVGCNVGCNTKRDRRKTAAKTLLKQMRHVSHTLHSLMPCDRHQSTRRSLRNGNHISVPNRLEPKNRKDRGHPVANLAARPSATSDNVNKHLHKRPHSSSNLPSPTSLELPHLSSVPVLTGPTSGATVKTERGEHVTTGNRTRVVRLAAKGANPKFRLRGVTMTLYVAVKTYTTPDDYFKSSHQGQ
ncbi:hypothetical protein Bbelb_352460 [Branchiostoma belcheri]|nr:hypothetical protein Bbelb_352460 [Branchiostoma belcheri]